MDYPQRSKASWAGTQSAPFRETLKPVETLSQWHMLQIIDWIIKIIVRDIRLWH